MGTNINLVLTLMEGTDVVSKRKRDLIFFSYFLVAKLAKSAYGWLPPQLHHKIGKKAHT
jgi:hypothetical protein